MIRARNEAENVELVLESVADAFDEIVFVDNASTDETMARARAVKKRLGAKHIGIVSYPFRIARCGPEHAATSATSVHNLAYFYNWCLSQCRLTYVMKWDADMVLLPEAAASFRRFLGALLDEPNGLGIVPVQAIYVTPRGTFADPNELSIEPRVFPNTADFVYKKVDLFELLTWSVPITEHRLSEVCAIELKRVARNELDHWSITSDFPTVRKQREYRRLEALRAGVFEPELQPWIHPSIRVN